MENARLESDAGNLQRHHISAVSRAPVASLMPVKALPGRLLADRVRFGLRLRRVRQHPADRARAEAGRLRLGRARLRGRFGGSMIWFGSSAGVALSNMYPEARSVGPWLRHGWHVAIAYVVGFFVMLAVSAGTPTHRIDDECACACSTSQTAKARAGHKPPHPVIAATTWCSMSGYLLGPRTRDRAGPPPCAGRARASYRAGVP